MLCAEPRSPSLTCAGMPRRTHGGSDYTGAYHGQQPRHGNPNRNRSSPALPMPSHSEVSRGLSAPWQSPCLRSIGPGDMAPYALPLRICTGRQQGWAAFTWPHGMCSQSALAAVAPRFSQTGTFALPWTLSLCPAHQAGAPPPEVQLSARGVLARSCQVRIQLCNSSTPVAHHLSFHRRQLAHIQQSGVSTHFFWPTKRCGPLSSFLAHQACLWPTGECCAWTAASRGFLWVQAAGARKTSAPGVASRCRGCASVSHLSRGRATILRLFLLGPVAP